ncbi:MAG TPA: hypothetical protein VHC67_09615 [Gaiellaceae bacterium]|jgi:hypothetical protein|nr:hypothetical protein [Gaiellaceae bacterium]
MPAEATTSARAELRSWYLHDLQPRVAEAARRGDVDSVTAAAFHADLRKLLGLPPGGEA